MTVVVRAAAPFRAHLQTQIALVRAKNAGFTERLERLQARHGGGARLADEIATLVRHDEAFLARLEAHDWEALAVSLLAQLGAAVAERHGDGAAGAGAGDLPDTLALFWNGDLEEVCVAGPPPGLRRPGARRPGPGRGGLRDRAVLRFDALVAEMLGPMPLSTTGYAILFGHDQARNQRAVLSSVLSALVVATLHVASGAGELRAPLAGFARITYAIGPAAGPSHVFEPGAGGATAAASALEFAGAEAFGFVPERAIVRGLDEYVDRDPDVHLEHVVSTLGTGSVEQRDFVEPGGRRLRLVVEPAAGRVVVLRRGASQVIRKRMHLFVEPELVEREEHRADSPAEALELLRTLAAVEVARGYRMIYERIEDAAGQPTERGQAPLDWTEYT